MPCFEAATGWRWNRAAEDWLRQQGFRELRVRSQGEAARIELPAERITALLDPAVP